MSISCKSLQTPTQTAWSKQGAIRTRGNLAKKKLSGRRQRRMVSTPSRPWMQTKATPKTRFRAAWTNTAYFLQRIRAFSPSRAAPSLQTPYAFFLHTDSSASKRTGTGEAARYTCCQVGMPDRKVLSWQQLYQLCAVRICLSCTSTFFNLLQALSTRSCDSTRTKHLKSFEGRIHRRNVSGTPRISTWGSLWHMNCFRHTMYAIWESLFIEPSVNCSGGTTFFHLVIAFWQMKRSTDQAHNAFRLRIVLLRINCSGHVTYFHLRIAFLHDE